MSKFGWLGVVLLATAGLAVSAAPAHATTGTPTFGVGDASISEGNSGTRVVNIPVTLSESASPATATVHYTVSAGTATAVTDFTPLTKKVLKFLLLIATIQSFLLFEIRLLRQFVCEYLMNHPSDQSALMKWIPLLLQWVKTLLNQY